MKNFVEDGDYLTVTAPYALTSGAGCLIGSLFGVATADAASGATTEIATEGVYDLLSLSTDVNAVGEKAYWDNTNKQVTEASSGNTLIGVFTATKASGSTVSRVKLNATV